MLDSLRTPATRAIGNEARIVTTRALLLFLQGKTYGKLKTKYESKRIWLVFPRSSPDAVPPRVWP